jgi:hypothetical protein
MVNNLLEAGNKVVVYDSNQVGRILANPPCQQQLCLLSSAVIDHAVVMMHPTLLQLGFLISSRHQLSTSLGCIQLPRAAHAVLPAIPCYCMTVGDNGRQNLAKNCMLSMLCCLLPVVRMP